MVLVFSEKSWKISLRHDIKILLNFGVFYRITFSVDLPIIPIHEQVTQPLFFKNFKLIRITYSLKTFSG